MASVNLNKVKSAGSAGRLLAHMTRYDGQDVWTEYKNQDIDRERSSQNWVLHDTGESWRQLQTRLVDEVKDIDALQPPRRMKSDRVVLVTASIPCPAEIAHDNERLRVFFEMAYKTLSDFCGGHCSPGYVHFDEIHQYRDRQGHMQESRPHLHMALIPYTAERGVNCKAFMSRDRLREINRDLDRGCVRELGIHMLTGETPAHMSVERLKIDSLTREVENLQQERETLSRDVEQLREARAREEQAKAERERKRREAVKKDLADLGFRWSPR